MARPNKPWFRSDKNTWYATVDGKKISLGIRGKENKADAVKAWHRLMADGRTMPEVRAEVPTVATLVTAFLADAEARLKPATVRGYRDFLNPFADQHGPLRADRLRPLPMPESLPGAIAHGMVFCLCCPSPSGGPNGQDS
jgi:hypothetical protein